MPWFKINVYFELLERQKSIEKTIVKNAKYNSIYKLVKVNSDICSFQ